MKRYFFHSHIKVIGIFALYFAIFLGLQFSIEQFWTTDDPYYHARHSALIAETGNLTLVEPWINFHFFSVTPTDLSWGFHLMQALGIKFFGVIAGAKVVTAVLCALVFTVFYGILTTARVQKPFVWTALYFASSSSLLLRLMSERPHVLALIFIPLGWWFAATKKYIPLFFLSLLYTLLYEVSPYLPAIILIAVVAVFFYDRQRADIRGFIASISGSAVGFLLHPHSLNYLYNSFNQVFQVLWLRFSGVRLMIGGEIQQGEVNYLFLFNVVTLLGFALAIGSFFALRGLRDSRRGDMIFQLLTLSAVWFLVFLLVPRAIEYWIPITWLCIALTIDMLPKIPEWHLIRNKLQKFQSSFLFPLIHACIFLIFAANLASVFFEIPKRSSEFFSREMREVSTWLEKETPKGSGVFLDNWGYWTVLFFNSRHNSYSMGLEPTVLYLYDPRMYWLWQNILFSGEACDTQKPCYDAHHERVQNIAPTIRNVFGASYVLVRKAESEDKESLFNKQLESQKKSFTKVFGTNHFTVYKLVNL